MSIDREDCDERQNETIDAMVMEAASSCEKRNLSRVNHDSR